MSAVSSEGSRSSAGYGKAVEFVEDAVRALYDLRRVYSRCRRGRMRDRSVKPASGRFVTRRTRIRTLLGPPLTQEIVLNVATALALSMATDSAAGSGIEVLVNR